MKRLGISIIALALTTVMACSAAEPDTHLKMTEGRVRAMLPGSTVTAAYGRITNLGTEPIEIVGFSSDSFAEVGLHETRVRQGVSRMDSHPSWTLQPGDELELKPGGMHLMLMEPKVEIIVGSTVSLSLKDNSGKTFEFKLPVEAR